MKFKLMVWILLLPIFLFSLGIFFFEVAIYSTLPPDLGGTSFWVVFKNVWYRSVSFYTTLVILFLLLFFSFLKKRG
jgi:hypothetical protein